MEKRSLDRRRFIGQLSKGSMLGMAGMSPLAGLAQEAPAPAREAAHAFLSKPYLQHPTPWSMTVMWITGRNCHSWVEYGEGDLLDKKAHAETAGLINAYNRVNRIQLTSLQPGTRYRYKVCSREIADFQPYKVTFGETIESGPYSFVTPDVKAREVSWLVLNDIHDRPHSIPHLINLNGTDKYDFVFLNGDMFDFQTDEQQLIDHLLQPCTETFATHTPFLFVRGNHETRGKFARDLHHYFENIDNANYFSFTRGPVHFIVLDTGEDKTDDASEYYGLVSFDAYREKQARWLEQQLQTPAFKKAKYRVVMMHIPHYHSGDWHGTMHCRQLFGPLFNKYRIDLMLCGHTHRYGVFDPSQGEHHFPMIIGGGPKEGQRTLIKVHANEERLALRMLRDDGTEVGKYELKPR